MATALKQIRIFNRKHWVSKSEAARLRGVSRQAIWELVRRGRLTPALYGRRTYLRRSDVLNFTRRKRGRSYRVPSAQVIGALKRKRLDPSKWFSMTEAAYALQLTHQVVSDLIRRRRLRALTSDGKTLVLRSTVEKFKAQQPFPNLNSIPTPKNKHKKK